MMQLNSHSSADDEHRIGLHGSDMDVANASASTPAATGRLTLFRPTVPAASVALALDAHDGKNQDGCQAFVGSAMHGDPEAPGRRIRREFDDGRHFRSHCRNVAIRACLIKISTWLTAS
jgi:hypothetical protein